MLKNILIVVAVLIAALLAFAATRADTFRVERSAVIKAAPDKVFGLINDFHQWPQWSPWEKMDPSMQRTHSGAPSGQGAVYAWQGNDQVGQGRMEITEAAAPSRVAIKLDFIKPFQAHNAVTFTLAPQAEGTQVRWAMEGQASFVVKLMGLFVSMDKMVGKDFEAGLANMKAAAEKPA